MPSKPYRLTEGSLSHRFMCSLAKVQGYAGGFANGKTSALCIKAIRVGMLYPGANIMLGRATFPKLNSSLRPEFFKWFPPAMKSSFDKKENILVWKNGTTVNFRYVAQQGKQEEQTSSNLLSASYDFIGLDQAEDPEISYKDFLDLMGRLRGSAPLHLEAAHALYEQDGIWDPRLLPNTGPRQFVITANPSRNWIYREIVRPVQMYKSLGVKADNLMVDKEGNPVVELFEGSTYENKDNLPADYIEGLENTYKGQMRQRYLMGEWGAFEGLVYPQFDLTQHVIPHDWVLRHLRNEINSNRRLRFLEGYDHGLVSPSCYLLGFVDGNGRTFIIDGYYAKESTIEQTAQAIRGLRNLYSSFGIPFQDMMYADPAVFRRSSGNSKTVGVTVADLFMNDYGIMMQRGNNDIVNGIAKIQVYLSPSQYITHPVSGNLDAPYLYMSEKCDFAINEMSDYYWKRNPKGEYEDEPQDSNNHAMDTLRYMLTDRPTPAPLIMSDIEDALAQYTKWREIAPAQRGYIPRAVRR